MQAISRETLPLPATPKGVTKWAFIFVKRAKAKNSVISYLRVPRVGGMANASTLGFTPASNPERGNNIGATKWAFIYVKRYEPKHSVIAYLRVPRVRNYIWVGLTKSSKASRVKPRVRNDQCKQFYKRYLSPAWKPHMICATC